MGDLVGGMLVPHTPPFFDPDGGVPAFRPVVQGLRALGEEVARLRPDAIIIASAHWVTTFHHYVAGAARLGGILAATEVLEPVRAVSYDYPGDPALAGRLVSAGVAVGIPVVLIEEPTLPLDHETVIPLRYLTPTGGVPIVPISLCQLADLAETLRWGRAIGMAVRQGDKRVILAVTGTRCHCPVRGPGPGSESGCRALDDRVMKLVTPGDLAELETSLGELARGAHVEAGGRHLALLLGALGSGYRGRALGRGLAPGGGNALVALSPE